MKPIIIEVKDGKVNLTIKEFRTLVEDAYNTGVRDGSSTTLTTGQFTTDPYWWNKVTCDDYTGHTVTTTKTNNVKEMT